MKQSLSSNPNPAFLGSPFAVQDVSPEVVREHQKELHLIDVREPDEFEGELGHIPGAHLLVLGDLPERIQEIPKDRMVIFVCRSGGRSARACAFALEKGYTQVFNMKGGMLLWNELGFATE